MNEEDAVSEKTIWMSECNFIYAHKTEKNALYTVASSCPFVHKQQLNIHAPNETGWLWEFPSRKFLLRADLEGFKWRVYSFTSPQCVNNSIIMS